VGIRYNRLHRDANVDDDLDAIDEWLTKFNGGLYLSLKQLVFGVITPSVSTGLNDTTSESIENVRCRTLIPWLLRF